MAFYLVTPGIDVHSGDLGCYVSDANWSSATKFDIEKQTLSVSSLVCNICTKRCELFYDEFNIIEVHHLKSAHPRKWPHLLSAFPVVLLTSITLHWVRVLHVTNMQQNAKASGPNTKMIFVLVCL